MAKSSAKRLFSVYHSGSTDKISAGMSIREYHRGQYSYTNIKRVDHQSGVAVVDGIMGREKRIPLDRVIKQFIVKQSEFELQDKERIVMHSLSPGAKRAGLIKDASYQIKIDDNDKLILNNISAVSSKPIIIKSDVLNGSSLVYDYVKTAHQLSSQKRSNRLAIVSAPSYGQLKHEMGDIKRTYKQAELYCQNEASQKRIDKHIDHVPKPVNPAIIQKSHSLEDQVKAAVSYAIDTVASRTSTFTVEEITKKALEYGIQSPKGVETTDNNVTDPILKELRTQVKEGHVMFKQYDTGSVLLATKEAMDHENSIIKLIEDNKNSVEPFMSAKDIDDKLSETKLTQGQKNACRMIATTKDKFNMVQGYAGTGKSTMLKTLLSSLKEGSIVSQDNIIVLAPTHRAVKELKEKGIEGKTLQRFLVDHQKEPKNYDGKLILIDEMSMIGTDQFYQFKSIVGKDKVKCIYLGDNNQLQPVPSGSPSTLAFISDKTDINRAVMQEVKRQETPHLQRAVSHLTKNTVQGVSQAIATLVQSDSIIEAPLKVNADDEKEGEPPKTAIELIAEKYAILSKSQRDDTMIITPTNALRHDINTRVREQLIDKNDIKGAAVSLLIFEDSSLTDRELRHTKNHQVGSTIKYNGSYGTVTSIDPLNKRLVMQTNDQRTKIVSLIDSNTIIEKYHRNEIIIQSGDSLKWTKTDYKRGVLAHEKLKVLIVNPAERMIEVENEQGDRTKIDLKLQQNKHLDYAYSSTVYGSQGATVRNVLALFDSTSRLANSIESLYVTITRATHDVQLYTQDANDLVRSIANQKSSDQIVLRAFDKINNEGTQPVSEPKHQPKSTAKVYEKKPRFDAREIKQELSAQAEHVVESMLGKPNASLSSHSNWRYGSKGALSVFVSGDRQGSYKNFETGEGGDLLSLIMDLNEVNFKSALEQASRLIGHIPTSLESRISEPAVISKHDNPTKIDAEKYARMQKLVDRSIPITGTVAEKYLKYRGIEPGQLGDIRVLKRVNTGLKNNEIRPFSSALLAISRDEKGKMSAIQMTYLDPESGQKIGGLPIKKRSMGALKGSVVELKSTQNQPKYCFAAEGIETALSIKNGLEGLEDYHTTVVATLGISNFAHLDKATKAQNIVLILDNDGVGAQSQKTIDKVILKLQEAGKTVLTMKPEMIDGQKTDYNDLLKADKMDQIKADIERTMGQKEIDSGRGGDSRSDQNNDKTTPEIKKNPSDDREIFG